MRYYKCTCNTDLHTADLLELEGFNNEELKIRLAGLIGSFCNFYHDSKLGRPFKKEESAARGPQVFNWTKQGDNWHFTATVICWDYEDYINAEFIPYFEMTTADYIAIRTCIDLYKQNISEEKKKEIISSEDLEPVGSFLTNVYEIKKEYFLEVTKEEIIDGPCFTAIISKKNYPLIKTQVLKTFRKDMTEKQFVGLVLEQIETAIFTLEEDIRLIENNPI